MKNIQAQYQDLLEGKMSKSNFMRNVRMQFPQHVSPTTSFDDSVRILKGKRILSENTNTAESIRKLAPYTVAQEISHDLDHAMYNFTVQNGSPDPEEEEDMIRNLVEQYVERNKIDKSIAIKYLTNKAWWENLHYALEDIKIGIPKIRRDRKKGQVRFGTLGLNEAKKPEGVYGHNPNAENDTYRGIDHLNYYQVYHGIQYELAKMPEITDENYVKARKKVVDTILKDPDAYKQLQLANFKAVKEMDKDLEMKDVKKNNLTDKPNEMKVVAKDAKPNTQDTLEKKEKRKAKNGKGLQHMTQTPKGKLEAFATPGKEKVMALKEHILDEMTTQNPHHEEFHKGMEVYKKKGDGTPGSVIEFDGHTATVQWQDGNKEDLQRNVLTKIKPEKTTTELPSSEMKPRTMVKWSNNEEKVNEDPVGQQAAGDPDQEKEMRDTLIKKEDKKASLKDKLMKTVKELLFRDKKTGKVQSFQQNDPAIKDPQFNQVFTKA